MAPCHAEAIRQTWPTRTIAAASQCPQAHSGGWASNSPTIRLTHRLIGRLGSIEHIDSDQLGGLLHAHPLIMRDGAVSITERHAVVEVLTGVRRVRRWNLLGWMGR